jgi:hypothetical protein
MEISVIVLINMEMADGTNLLKTRKDPRFNLYPRHD